VLVVRDGDTQPQVSPSVVTIGAYDGVHIGHRAVIGQVRDEATRLGAHSVVVTFDRHPASVVRPETAPLLIADDEQKIELLGSTGVDATYVVTFGDEQSSESPERFVERVLVGRLGVRGVVVGEDFHFGHRRAGSVETLRAMGAEHGFEVIPVRLMARPDGVTEPVSSTAIRRALAGGQVESAATLLGRPFEVRGTVVHGDHRGRTIGFPTANVDLSDGICLPADGVYAGRFDAGDGTWRPCAINLGRRPTVVERAARSTLEAHLIDFDGDLYGRRVKVTFERFLRSERRFDGLDALKAQLQRDVAAAREALGSP